MSATPRDRLMESLKAQKEAPFKQFETDSPMRDGIELAADVYLPAESEVPAPAIVTMTPYDKSSWLAAPEARMYQDRGYAFVAIDVRGRVKSEGEWRDFVNDGPDGHDAIEWVA